MPGPALFVDELDDPAVLEDEIVDDTCECGSRAS